MHMITQKVQVYTCYMNTLMVFILWSMFYRLAHRPIGHIIMKKNESFPDGCQQTSIERKSFDRTRTESRNKSGGKEGNT